ncbi:uncharacterized protein LOC106084621 isoform X3 [Stomoxys calcitrans]|nr:uncharacterized protein LOC106084621 isoform X3 [Stomoxys calcitrans]
MCNICLKPVPLPSIKVSPHFQIRDYFHLNKYLLGELNSLRYYNKEGSANSTLLATNQTSLFSCNSNLGGSLTAQLPLKCKKCEFTSAVGKCRQCNASFCKACFESVHKANKILKMHKLQRLDMSNKSADIEPRFCRRHKQTNDRFCSKCNLTCCSECAQNDHQFHGCQHLMEVNKSYLDSINTTLQNARSSRECIKKALKDVKSVERKLEEYATKTTENVADYFLQLHSLLQNEEKRIMDKFNEKCQQPLLQLKTAYSRLHESQEVINAMYANLESYQFQLPSNINIGRVLLKYNDQLDHIPCQVNILKPPSNPFIFEGKKGAFEDLHKYIIHNFDDSMLCVQIRSISDDSNMSILDASSSRSSTNFRCDNSMMTNITPNLKKQKDQQLSLQEPKQIKQKTINNSRSTSSDFEEIMSIRVSSDPTDDGSCKSADNRFRVAYVKTPEYFFICKPGDLANIRKLSDEYLDHRLGSIQNITVGQYYMAYNERDKIWYRSVLKKILSNELYKVFLLDLGNFLEVSSDKLSDLREGHLNIPFAALRCAIADIVPNGKRWSEAAKSLLIELVQNDYVRVSLIEKLGESYKVDLETSVTKSVRDSFLYTGLAREGPGSKNFKMRMMKYSATAKSDDQIPKNFFRAGEVLMVNMLNALGPQEFYVIKEDSVHDKASLVHDLNVFYGPQINNHQQIYLPLMQMCCVVFLNETWHRAAIEEIKDEGSIKVRLVDEGQRFDINWRQAFVLTEEFRKKREFAIRCTLVDIEPMQENSYSFSAAAIEDFKQMAANPCLRMEIQYIKESEIGVVLYVGKRNLDINIGAALVRNKHGISTGETTQAIDYFKNFSTQNPPQNLDYESKWHHRSMSTNSKQSQEYDRILVKRSSIIVTHIVHPGEFYIQLSDFTKGTNEFHSKIQESQNQKFSFMNNDLAKSSKEKRNWPRGRHCLVYSKYESSSLPASFQKNFEWYRGIVTATTRDLNTEPTYSVFLRDIGATIRSISADQIFPIDSQLDRVANAVYCCHLAGIRPAGGVKSWSQSSIEFFTYLIKTFESLSVSLRGKRLNGMPSLPVVLWGSTTKTADPLAPSIMKFTNFSRVLVDRGLAFNAETIDMSEEFQRIEELELKEGEITLNQWFKTFDDDTLLNAITLRDQHPFTFSEDFSTTTDGGNVIVDSDLSDNHPLSVYISEFELVPTTGLTNVQIAWSTSKDINKTIFTGYATYVDYGCIIYLHEADDKPFLDRIKEIVSEKCEHLAETTEDYEYLPNQPCIARYHLDSKYYRAVIHEQKKNDKGEWTVRFVDYGNIETVEPENLRPYAPFPNLPSIVNKYTLSGIRPRNNFGEFTIEDLDQMHRTIVGKFVSVRLPVTELSSPIKKCTMRLGTIDVASAFIEKGMAAREEVSTYFSASNQLPIISFSVPKKLLKTRNPLTYDDPTEPDKDYEVFDHNVGTCSIKTESVTSRKVDEDWPIFVEEKLDLLQEHHTKLTCVQSNIVTTTNSNIKSYRNSITPPIKRRMFDNSDYTQMMKEGMMAFDIDDLNNTGDDQNDNKAFFIDEDNNDDIVEMSHSFAMDYWHSAVDDMNEDGDREICQQLERRISFEEDEDIESDFEEFHPNETSTVFSHVSDMETFGASEISLHNSNFKCRVVKIVSTTVLLILPTQRSLRQRHIQIQKDIKEAVRVAAPLTRFETRTICLACYSKDKEWYRAVIRCYNQIAKSVEVFYIDYQNSETLPLKYVKVCPVHIANYPPSTLRVRLHGICPNPQIRELEIRRALHDLVIKRNLFGIVKRNSSARADSCSISSLMEICLYKSPHFAAKGIVIYEHLIEKGYYRRI